MIGVFDIENTSTSKITREFLNKMGKENKVVYVSYDMPKSFVVTKNKDDKKTTVYISQLSSSTLEGRSKTFLGYK
jgi:hypothetical protein